ncbi:MAG: ester cyclase [Chloroflexota bacterium]|nr:ester cyclase [Chloroflexota bacterium]
MDGARIDQLARWLSRDASRRKITKATAGSLLAAVTLGRLPVGLTQAQQATPCPAPTPDELRAIAEAYFDAFNTGDADALARLLAPTYTHQGALVSEQDRELHQGRLRQNRAAFPDGRYALDQIIAQDDLVAIRHVFTGTLQAPYAGVEPAGQAVAVRGVHIHRVACGQITETWNNGDALGLLRQIGALPPAGPAPRTPEEAATGPQASPVADCPSTTAAENAAIGRRWTEEALDQHDLDVIDEIVAPDVVHHSGVFVDEIGRDALKANIQAIFDGFPDSRFTADVVVAEDDAVAVRWTARGTHEAEFLGIAPTGIPVEFTGTNVYRIARGLIVESWSEPDARGLLTQLGALPEIPPPVSTPTS